jgi:DNA helicase IV
VTRAWTVADVPLLDEAAELLGEDDRWARARAERERETQIAYAQGVLDVSYASRTYEFEDKEDSDPEASEVLSAHDIIDAERFAERHEEADHRSAAERAAADRTWAFGHIIVDEAQELSPMAWRLLMRRSPTRSMTLVGDPAQTAEAAGVGSWADILAPYVEDRWEHTRLGVNYRTPAEIMELAAAVVRAENPDFEPPSSVRSTGVRPWVRRADGDLPEAVAKAVAELTPAEGRLAVIAPRGLHRSLAARLDGVTAGAEPDLTRTVVLLDPRQAKGLEFDSVLVVEPGDYGTSDLYVALTRATQRLGVLYRDELPKPLAAGVTGE